MKEKFESQVFRALEKKGLRWNPETEEIEDTKRWRAKMGETYFYVGSDADVYPDEEIYSKRNDRYWELGNYFRTMDEAAKYLREFFIMFKERTLDKE